jgi:hypothetical protein
LTLLEEASKLDISRSEIIEMIERSKARWVR